MELKESRGYSDMIHALQSQTGLSLRKIAHTLDMSYRTWQAWKSGVIPDRSGQLLIEILLSNPSFLKKRLKKRKSLNRCRQQKTPLQLQEQE